MKNRILPIVVLLLAALPNRLGAVVVSSSGGQPADADLTAIAALSGTNNIYYRSAANTWSSVTIGAGLDFTAGSLTATGGGGGAPGNATYITQTPDGTLSNEQALSALATGIVKVTTTTGVLSTAAEGTDYYKPGGTDVAVADGGTGASSASAARTNLGLGTIATQDANNVSITGGSATGLSSVTASSAGTVGFASRTLLSSPSDGVLELSNNAVTDFTRLQFGGTTSSFPSLKRVTSSLQCRLADDSGFCNLQTNTLTVNAALNQTASGSATSIASTSITLTNIVTSDPTADNQLWRNGTLICTGNFDASAARTALGVVAATTSASGISELATSAETTTGTDTVRTLTPDGLSHSEFGQRVITIMVSDPNGSAITTGDGKTCFRVPTVMNGWNLVGVGMSCSTVSSSGLPTVQLRRSRRASATTRTDADMLSTKLTLDASEFDTVDAATAAVIDTSNDDVNTGDMVYVDIDVAGTGCKGLVVQMRYQLP